MAISFSIPNTEVIMTSPQVAVTCQDLVNAIREFEDDFQMMSRPNIIDAEGKVSIGGTTFTEIVLKILFPWTLRFVDEATQHTEVTGGTLVALDAVGAKRPPTTNPSLVINQSISGTLVESGTSGLTPTEQAQWAQMVADMTLVRAIESGRWDIDAALMTFYKEDNTTVVAIFELRDAAGNPTSNPADAVERVRVGP